MPALMKNGVTRVKGISPARLVTMLMPPPTLPPGAMPLISAPGPRSNSIRSMKYGGNMVGCHQAVEAVEADVAGAHLEAADLERVVEAVVAGGSADRRIIDQRIRCRARLLILDQLRRIVRVLNGTFMTFRYSKQAERSALCHLTASIGGSWSSDRPGRSHRRGGATAAGGVRSAAAARRAQSAEACSETAQRASRAHSVEAHRSTPEATPAALRSAPCFE